jgi:hypothetical protein
MLVRAAICRRNGRRCAIILQVAVILSSDDPARGAEIRRFVDLLFVFDDVCVGTAFEYWLNSGSDIARLLPFDWIAGWREKVSQGGLLTPLDPATDIHENPGSNALAGRSPSQYDGHSTCTWPQDRIRT